jgi:hypothetical protein
MLFHVEFQWDALLVEAYVLIRRSDNSSFNVAHLQSTIEFIIWLIKTCLLNKCLTDLVIHRESVWQTKWLNNWQTN